MLTFRTMCTYIINLDSRHPIDTLTTIIVKVFQPTQNKSFRIQITIYIFKHLHSNY